MKAIALALLLLGAVLPLLGGGGGRLSVTKERAGRTQDGQTVERFTLRNGKGMEVAIISYGAIVTAIRVPDRNGTAGDVVLGFDSLAGYLGDHPYFGCIAGRYANRIAKGRFTLEGVTYTLATNNNGNHLHGGVKGFDKRMWKAKEVRGKDSVGVLLLLRSQDGDEGYPGTLTARVLYSLNRRNELRIDYEATTDKPTIVNLTHHGYFNLAGRGDVLGHEMMIDADRYTVVDKNLIPTGELRPVAGTPMDFRTPRPIGAKITEVEGGGYDHNYVLTHPSSSSTRPALAARVTEPTSGRVMEVWTTEPGVQFYSGNFLDGTLRGKHGAAYLQHAGFCLEAQHFPDSPNQTGFPSAVLRPGETYRQTTVYTFSVHP